MSAPKLDPQNYNPPAQRHTGQTMLRLGENPWIRDTLQKTNVEVAIRVEDLCKVFGKIKAVDHLSFSVPGGTTCALLGANGAGKTTTLSMLLGLLLPTSGS
ncbi:MAG: ATP-binding cassette domain-containing protein, partial [Methylococcaceae bacterium]|nr:ATP-binding cassette domain-containing protein [Methylococcaceae bacterium]